MSDFFKKQTNLSGQNCSPKCAQTTFKGCKVNHEKFPGLWSQRKGHGSLFINDPIKRRKLCRAVSSRALHETRAASCCGDGVGDGGGGGWGHKDSQAGDGVQGWTRCSRSVMSHILVVTGRPLGWMGQDADLGQPSGASISLASFPGEPPAGPEGPWELPGCRSGPFSSGNMGWEMLSPAPSHPHCTRGHPAGPHSYLYARLPSSLCTQGPSPFLPDDRTCPDQCALPWD